MVKIEAGQRREGQGQKNWVEEAGEGTGKKEKVKRGDGYFELDELCLGRRKNCDKRVGGGTRESDAPQGPSNIGTRVEQTAEGGGRRSTTGTRREKRVLGRRQF